MYRIKQALQRFMMGRYGNDKLNMVILGTGVIASLLSIFIRVAPFNLILSSVSYVLMAWAIFRTW